MTTKRFAQIINDGCKKHEYVWACGMVRNTLERWKGKNLKLLSGEAQVMVYYLRKEAGNGLV